MTDREKKMARLREITRILGSIPELSAERRQLINELHPPYSLRYIAGELGISATRVWQIANGESKTIRRD
jgi:hypothetical protein